MQATVGDKVLVPGRWVGAAERHGEIVEVHGENGAPPYLVRWSDGQEALIFPGPDTVIQPV
jgi:hypothetical protein